MTAKSNQTQDMIEIQWVETSNLVLLPIFNSTILLRIRQKIVEIKSQKTTRGVQTRPLSIMSMKKKKNTENSCNLKIRLKHET